MMKINNNNNHIYLNKSPNFKGIEYAKAILKRNPNYGEITLYQLEKKDIPFLQDMLRNIRLEKLAPEITDKTQLGEWKHLIKEAVGGLKRDEDVYLSTYQNRPCGIMSQLEKLDNELSFVSYVATWPYKVGENVKCAGKVLFKNIFEQAKNQKRGVSLVMSSKAPKGKRDNRPFYEKLKFQYLNDKEEDLKIVKNKDVPIVIKNEFDTAFSFYKTNSTKSENLKKVLDINY